MITGAHAVVFSEQPERLRAFFKDVLGWPSVDAHDGWLIFALPPAELAVHPSPEARTELWLMCGDLERTLAEMAGKGVETAPEVQEQSWGRASWVKLPDGERLGLYQPSHPTAIPV